MTSCSWRTFLTQWARCHWTLAHSAGVTSGPAGQSGPVRLDELALPVGVGLLGQRHRGGHDGRIKENVRVIHQQTADPAVKDHDDRRICVRPTTSVAARVCTASWSPQGVLPQAAARLDPRPEIWPDEVRIDVETLNLDAASYRQLTEKHHGDGDAVRAEVLDIVATRGKMQNPVTGSGGMLVGTVAEVGPQSPLGLAVGDRVATLVSLSLTPLRITDGLERWDGRSEQVPASGHAILFGRSIAAVLPDDLDPRLALMVMDVCGAPALVARVVRDVCRRADGLAVAVLGGGRQVRVALPGRRSGRRRRTAHRRRPERARGRHPACLGPRRRGRCRRCPCTPRPVRSGPRRRRTRRRHGRLRGRPGMRAAGHPRHGGRRHRRVLLDGHQLRGGGPRSRGAGRRRHACSSATATSRGTPPTRSTCSDAYRPSVRCSRLASTRGPAGRSRRPRRGPGGSSTGPWPRRRRAGRSGRPGSAAGSPSRPAAPSGGRRAAAGCRGR